MNKLLTNLKLPFISLLFIALLYGGLNITKLQKSNVELSSQLEKQALKIALLEDSLNENISNTENLKNDKSELEKQVSSLKNQLAYQINKQVLGASTEENNKENKTEVQNTVQTITKIVTVKEKPVKSANVTIKGLGSYKVILKTGDTAFSVLQRAASENKFALTFEKYDFGVFVTGIGGITPIGNQYWAFYYNGSYSQVGASDQKVASGDTIFWQLESF